MTHYLVKWCSLPYEDSTWELGQDIDPAKIEEFEKLLSREPETERVVRGGCLWRVQFGDSIPGEVSEKPLMGFTLSETGTTSC